MQIKRVIFPLLLSVLFLGCTTSRNEKYAQVDSYVKSGNYGAALAVYEDDDLAGSLYNSKKDKVLYYLDKGMLGFYDQRYQMSIDSLERAESLIEEYFTKSISQGAASYLLNDNVIEYGGEVHEDLYVNLFKALSFLETGYFDGAYVEIRRLTDKLNYLTDKYRSLAQEYNQSEKAELDIELEENRFYNSALARYLSMLIYRADGNWDSARIDRDEIKTAFNSQSHIYDFPLPDLDPYLEPTEKARLNVLGFSGLGPLKRANTFYIKGMKNGFVVLLEKEENDGKRRTVEVEDFYWPGMENSYFFKFQLPYMDRRGTAISGIRVKVDGQVAGELELIESLENVAFETYKLKEPIIYIKTITRTIVKGLVAEEAKKAAKKEAEKQVSGLGGGLLGLAAELAADVAVDASEQADLRSARFFPSHAFTGEIWLDPGVYNIQLEYLSGSGVVAVENYPEYVVKKGNLNLLSSYLPQ